MSVIEMARELGKTISTSQEMLEYKKWEAIFNGDAEAKAKLSEYTQLQNEMAVEARKENTNLVEIREKMAQKYKEVMDNEVCKNYIQSKEKLQNMIKTVNDVLIYSISGEEACGGSAGGCSSCSGCG